MGAADANALQVLRNNSFPAAYVVAVHPDAILYVTPAHQARTCWLHADPLTRQLTMKIVGGFPAHPPDGFPPVKETPEYVD